jgi:hypothetical protein
MAQIVSRISSANPSVSFHVLPAVDWANYDNVDIEARYFTSFVGNYMNLLDLVTDLTKNNCVRAMVFDFFSSASLDAAQRLLILAYVYSVFGASDFAVFLHAMHHHETGPAFFRNLGKSLGSVWHTME